MDEHELVKWETEYKKGFAKPMILLSLAKKENYPYQITKSIVEETQGKISIAGSNIYPILKNMLETGIIDHKPEAAGSKKKIYSLTENGKKFMIELTDNMKDFLELMLKQLHTIETVEELKK